MKENRRYELVVVLKGSLPENEQVATLTRVQELLVSFGAEELQIKNWGRKEIPHPVAKESYGQFLCFEFCTTNSELVDVMNRQLRIIDSVLNFQAHKVETGQRKFQGNPLAFKFGGRKSSERYNTEEY